MNDRARRPSAWMRLSPARLFVASFAGMVLVGTVGLRFLPGLCTADGLDWLDALFTATSAVCVTGLIVVDTAEFFTPAGQGVLLLLIQAGGLGILTFSSLAAVLLGRRLSLGQELLVSEASRHSPRVDIRRLLKGVLVFTFMSEIVGAVVLTFLWAPRLGFGGAAGAAVFHSISAFCNSGFSTFSDSLVGWRESPAVLAVVAALLVIGGIGFLTLVEVRLLGAARLRRRRFRVSLHSRIVLAVSATLLLGGAAMFAFLEWNGALAGLSTVDRWMNGLFMSATARTAGFATIDYAQATEGTSFLTMVLMFIGGAPGSTAGGVKVTTLAVILLFATARLSGRRDASVWARSIPGETVRRALELALIAFLVISFGLFVLAALGSGGAAGAGASGGADALAELGPPDASTDSFHAHAFEVVSAFNTVGLTMGATSELSPGGKWIVILLMFLGRVGPLTFIGAIATSGDPSARFRYAREDVAIG